MKKSKILIFAFIIFSHNSCQKGIDQEFADKTQSPIVLLPSEYQSIAFDKPKSISSKEAEKIILKFLEKDKQFKKDIKSQFVIEESFKIDLDNNVKTKSGISNSHIPIYKYSISNVDKSKEIAYVSADERYSAVLAYYKAPKDSEISNEGNELMLSAAFDAVRNEIKEVEKNRSELRSSTIKKLATQLSVNEKEIKFEEIKSRILVQESSLTKASRLDLSNLGATVSVYGPYLQTAWSKGMPYNRTMVQACPNNWLWDNRYAISSAVVATAQILAAYQPSMSIAGTTMNWIYLTQNPEIHEETDYFGSYVQDPLDRRNMVAELMRGLGIVNSVSYTCTSSSVNFTTIRNWLASKGINVAPPTPLSVPSIRNSIENMKPVFVYGQTSTGGGHWWVIDGAAITVGSQSYTPGYNYYLHANMGEASYYLGYYLVGTNQSVTFVSGFAHFSKNFQAYHITTAL